MELYDKKEGGDSSIDNTLGLMPIANVFGIPGAAVTSGLVTEGSFSVGDDVVIVHEDGRETATKILAIEVGMAEKCNSVSKDQRANIQLSGIAKAAVSPGSVLKRV